MPNTPIELQQKSSSGVEHYQPDSVNIEHKTECDEYHVASFIAQTMPVNKEKMSELINSVEGAEVHVASDEGKIVFTIEAKSQKIIAQQLDLIKYHTEILNLSPVYHQFLSE